MALKITQETFDAAVNENILEFDMSPEDAVADALKQFESQGVDVSQIKNNFMSNSPETESAIDSALEKLVEYLKIEIDKCEYIKQLQLLKAECDKGLQYRVYAGKHSAYDTILSVIYKFDAERDVVKECLKTLTVLMTQQPDLLDDRGIALMITFMVNKKDNETRKLLLKWVKECCVMHEKNRQNIFNAGILEHLKPILVEAGTTLLRDVLGVLRALVLDDDVRVEFGKAHEHARVIASDTLCTITSLLDHFNRDEVTMYDLMLTLSALIVRTEFCKKLEDAGGLTVVQEAMERFQHSDKLVRQCLKLLKVLAGNDECKVHLIQNGAAPIVVSAVNKHKKTALTAVAGLGCVAALTLRCPENSKALFEAGIPEVIVDIMRIHIQDGNVQRNASWAIRNMVSRSRDQNKKFLELGVEKMLLEDLRRYKKFEYDIKSALRDLGCEVKLKEEWTGKGGLLTTQGSIK